MTVCFPVFQNQGLSSLVSSHFDSAPLCVIVDTATHSLLEVANRVPGERHGLCREIVKRSGERARVFVVDGIGASALAELRQAGFRVFQAQPGTVADNLEHIARNELAELTDSHPACGVTQPQGNDDDDLPRFGCGF
jgi:predicted Fe-Mo cluster-binding NifX family protein